ncbi:MAG: portal protein [Pontibacterium sp.]
MALLQIKSNAQIDEEAAQVTLQQERLIARQQYEQSIAGQINRDWERAKQAKRDVEERMLDCLRRRKGEYSQEKLAEIRETGGSEIYMQLTATKCRAAFSWIRDVLMPTNEKPWGLEPTPIAEVPPFVMQALVQEIQMAAQAAVDQGQNVDIRELAMGAAEEIKERANTAAKEAAEKMELTIEDQLAEGGWIDALEQFIDDFVTFPSAILKAPVLKRKSVLSWADGWQPVKTYEVLPHVERISPFDFYPSQDATTPDDAAFLFERARFSRSDIQAMRGVPGYSEEAIEEVLREHGQGGLKSWLWTDSERAHIEDRGHEWLSSDASIDGLIYSGSTMGLSLLQWGAPADEIDPLAEYEIEAILIGRHVVRLVVNEDPLERRPYSVASYHSIPGAFWGQSPPELMADIQDTCNATARALINNMAAASGPMVEVNYDRLAPGEDGESIYPWRLFQTKSSQASGNNPAIRFYQPAMHSAELFGVYEKFEQKADEVTNIPRYMYGSQNVGGAGATASGLSMLMESANKGIKAAIGHIDKGVIRRVIEGFWMYNMLYNPDRSIKGDCKVRARGSSAMLMRERTQMMRNEFLQATANPMDQQLVGLKNRARLLSTIASQLDINEWDNLEEAAEQAGQANMQNGQIAEVMQKLEQLEMQAKIEERKAKAQKLLAEVDTQPAEKQKILAEIDAIIANMGAPVHDQTQQTAVRGISGRSPVTGLRGLPLAAIGGS